MLETTVLYKTILADSSHWEENKVVIGSTTFTESDIESISTQYGAFSASQPTIGGAVQGSINLVLRKSGYTAQALSATIANGARIRPYVRLGHYSGGSAEYSEWLQQGDFWIDTRSADFDSMRLTIRGVDRMAIAEFYYPSVNHTWPYTDIDVVNEIASFMSVTVDPITTALMTAGYSIPDPSDYTMRETLGFIAAMYGGNFIISKSGTLLLLALHAIPAETHYLVDRVGNAITFGGVRILV